MPNKYHLMWLYWINKLTKSELMINTFSPDNVRFGADILRQFPQGGHMAYLVRDMRNATDNTMTTFYDNHAHIMFGDDFHRYEINPIGTYLGIR